MTEKRLYELNSLQETIRGFEKLLLEIEKDHWVRFKTPSHEIPLPIPLRCELKEWVEQQLSEARKKFEEA